MYTPKHRVKPRVRIVSTVPVLSLLCSGVAVATSTEVSHAVMIVTMANKAHDQNVHTVGIDSASQGFTKYGLSAES